MFKVLTVLAIALSVNSASAAQTYFSCSMPITGGYALEGQEFAVVIKTDDRSLSILGGSSDPIYSYSEITTTDFTLTAGGPNGWPKAVTAKYVSEQTGTIETATAVFKVGKQGRPAITYTSTEAPESFELQCY